MLVAPGSTKIFIIQFFSIVPFGTAFMFCLVPILYPKLISIHDLIMLSFFVVPLLFCGVLLLYIPNKYKYVVLFDEKTRNLKIRRRKNSVFFQKVGLESVLLFEKELTNPGCIFKIVVKNSQNDRIKLFEEKLFFGTTQWETFAEKLSKLMKLKLVKNH